MRGVLDCYSVRLKLLDYHRLRSEEERSWSRDRLQQEAGPAFVAAVEPLLPVHEEKWARGKLVRFTRSPWFDNCVQLCELYRAAGEPRRTWLRSRVDRKIGGKLGLFGLRAAILAARERSQALARASLIAFAIVDLVEGDIRDVLIGLSLLCHCARLAGADVAALLRETSALAGPAMRTLFEEWAARYPNVQGIGSMGWKEVHTEEGIGFENA